MTYDDSDEYRAVTVTMQQLRVNSIMVTVPKMQGWQPIPRSLIHGGDDRMLIQFQHACPCEVTIRIFAWKADELHLS